MAYKTLIIYTILNLYLLILLVFSATPIRHAYRPVWVNMPFAHWSVVFLDPTAAAAVIDRIVHHATVLQHEYRRGGVSGRERRA